MSDNPSSNQSPEIERLRMRYGLLKFLLGTSAVSILSVVINWQIQNKKLEFEIRTKESEFIAQFLVHGLEKELEKRRDFAAYFVRLSPTEEARTRWLDYLKFVEDLISKAMKRKNASRRKTCS